MSLWEKDLAKWQFATLKKDIEVDTLIIGGGLTGCTLLYYLKNYPSVCLVEKNTIGCGVTKNTTGKLTYLQGAIYSDLQKNISEQVASDYLKSQKMAISLIKDIIKKEHISCNLEKVTSFLHADKAKDLKKLESEKKFLQKHDISVQEGKYSLAVSDTYVFHPLKYINGLMNILKSKQIYEHTNITKIKYQQGKYVCFTKSATITAQKVIVTCHYPFFLLPFCLPLKSHIEKSYIIAYKVPKNEHCSGITISNPGFSYRYLEDKNNIYKICLSSSHATSINQNDSKNFLKVLKLFQIPQNKVVACWSNVDIITDDKLPFIGAIKPNFYLATGFNTWGMTNGILAAKILADAILQKENPYASIFQPKRINFYKVKNFFNNTTGSIIALLTSFKFKKWYPKNLHFVKKNGIKVAIYQDEKGNIHKVVPICPHMKCGLIFNEIEKTWDCPCHSSRFTLDGICLKGPSTKNITYKE